MIKGAIYIPNFISDRTAEHLLQHIETEPWQSSLSRLVQQFGPVYNYETKKLDAPMFPIPAWLEDIVFPRLQLLKFFERDPDQVIVNDYQKGQGISRHIDSPLFGPTVASLSLISDAPMILGRYSDGTEHTYPLAKNSLLILTDEARNDWYHMVPKVTTRRVSITMRTIKKSDTV